MRIRVRILALALAYLLVAGIVAGFYYAARMEILDIARQNARNLAASAAMHVDAADLEALAGDLSDVENPAFDRVRLRLLDFRAQMAGPRHVYTVRPPARAGEEWIFLVDAEPFARDEDGDGVISDHEEATLPGQVVDTPPTAERYAALVRPAAERTFIEDAWGTYLTGWAPIRSPRDGRTVALVGVDIPRAMLQQQFSVVLASTVSASVLLFALIAIVLYAFFRKSIDLTLVRALQREVSVKNDALAAALAEVQARQRQVNRDLEVARELQLNFLPAGFPAADSLRVSAFYDACSSVGGDFYDVLPIGRNHVGFYMADVSGHGLSAAMITGILKTTIDRFWGNVEEAILHDAMDAGGLLRLCLAEVNRAVGSSVGEFRFVTLLFGIIDLREGTLLLANAGHHDPVRVPAGGGAPDVLYVAGNPPIGIMPDQAFDVEPMAIGAGDTLVVYTDGFIERRGEGADDFGRERLLQAVAARAAGTVEEIVSSVVEANDLFSGGRPADDDRALLAIRWTGPRG